MVVIILKFKKIHSLHSFTRCCGNSRFWAELSSNSLEIFSSWMEASNIKGKIILTSSKNGQFGKCRAFYLELFAILCELWIISSQYEWNGVEDENSVEIAPPLLINLFTRKFIAVNKIKTQSWFFLCMLEIFFEFWIHFYTSLTSCKNSLLSHISYLCLLIKPKIFFDIYFIYSSCKNYSDFHEIFFLFMLIKSKFEFSIHSNLHKNIMYLS